MFLGGRPELKHCLLDWGTPWLEQTFLINFQRIHLRNDGGGAAWCSYSELSRELFEAHYFILSDNFCLLLRETKLI